MDSFLTEIYFELFENQKKIKLLMENHPVESNDNIRNDQSIYEAQKINDILRKLIERYIFLHIKRGE